MRFYFSKENREKRLKERELERQNKIEIEKLKKEQDEKLKKEYCIWYTKQTQNFINQLYQNNFKPSWGFEVEPSYNIQQGEGGKQYGNIFVFDIPEIVGLAFDMNSKQMLYYLSSSGYYSKYKDNNTQLKYKYALIPFTKIFKATVEVNSQITSSTITSKQNVVGRSIIGGILAGDTGAIIGGVTAKNNSISKSEVLPKKIIFNIQTTDKNYPIISFEFSKPFNATGTVSADKTIADTMYGIFSGEPELATFIEWKQQRNCNTNIDYYYHRVHGSPNYDENNSTEYEPVLDYILPIENLEVILKRVNKYVMQIESIIQQCNIDNQTNKENVISELNKLADMKEKGIITSDEFEKLKKRLI